MKAAAIREHGGLEKLEVLDVPEPRAGAGQAVVAVRAAALNHLDIWVRRGGRASIPMPHVLGSDAAGVVAAVGQDVAGVELGQEVVVYPGLGCGRCECCRRGERNLCNDFGIVGLNTPGTFAEKVAVPAANVRPKPAHLTWEEAGALTLAHLTAWRMLMTRAALRAGETVLIHGVGGGVALAALQLAKLAGAEAIVTSSSNEKLAKAVALGADHAVNYAETDGADLPEVIREATGGRGVDVVLDTVGAATWPVNFAVVRRGGRIVHCGVTGGADVHASVRKLYWDQITVMGSTLGGEEDLRLLLRAVAVARLRPVIDSVHPLDDARAATERMEAGRQFGKIVLRVV